jgi:hypothetical protein
MAAIALDPLEYTHALEEAGFTRDQAELVARVGTTMFVQNFDALVTRDYLDARFSEFEARVEGKMDRRFDALEVRFERMDGKFSRIYLLFGLTMVTATIPILQNFFARG